MKVGDLVKFPCDFEGYQIKIGILLGFRDNPADLKAWELRASHGVAVPGYCKEGPRQIADIMYGGCVAACWAHNLEEVKNESVNESR